MRSFGGAGSLIGSVRAEGRMAPGVDSLAKLSGTRAVMASREGLGDGGYFKI